MAKSVTIVDWRTIMPGPVKIMIPIGTHNSKMAQLPFYQNLKHSIMGQTSGPTVDKIFLDFKQDQSTKDTVINQWDKDRKDYQIHQCRSDNLSCRILIHSIPGRTSSPIVQHLDQVGRKASDQCQIVLSVAEDFNVADQAK